MLFLFADEETQSQASFCLMILILNYFNSESEGALPHPTITTEYTTKSTPTVDIDPQVSWMSPI